MPEYPRAKSDKDVLYQAIIEGITNNPTEYPSGPGQMFEITTFQTLVTAKNNSVTARQQKEAEFRIAVTAENDSYDAADLEARRLITLAEAQHAQNPENLQLIGWGAPDSPTSTPPGQPRNLEMCVQFAGGGMLDWKPPTPQAMNGPVNHYRIEREVRDLSGSVTEEFGVWQKTTTKTEFLVTDQPRGVEIVFRVFAVNSNGDSPPSNSVTVVV